MFEQTYDRLRESVERALKDLCQACPSPQPLRDAMAYSLLAGGKRIRPVMLLSACEAFGGSIQEAMPFACALEMIHSYSLIHDDMPEMDDDSLRRGKPTNHTVFGQGMALLAGDGLLSWAFETMLAQAQGSQQRWEAMRTLARAAGVTGMVSGQCRDLAQRPQDGEAELYRLCAEKTGGLLAGAASAGAALAGADAAEQERMWRYGIALGVSFQIQDDLLDILGDPALLGKQTGMDKARGKMTYPALLGIDRARQVMEEQTRLALELLGERAPFLSELTRRLLQRDH
ncbi:MAG TPA: polyprenyl synthetase family protein [Candidatus Aphodomonas merdavium]|nr:polyprenyl synthetase family protein [Candidatus Aphodomonas merdavium]